MNLFLYMVSIVLIVFAVLMFLLTELQADEALSIAQKTLRAEELLAHLYQMEQ